jgi:hypothetical protein
MKQIHKSNNQYYSEKEIAKRFKVTVVTLCNMRKAGKIDFIKIGNSVRYPQHVYDGIIKLDRSTIQDVKHSKNEWG